MGSHDKGFLASTGDCSGYIIVCGIRVKKISAAVIMLFGHAPIILTIRHGIVRASPGHGLSQGAIPTPWEIRLPFHFSLTKSEGFLYHCPGFIQAVAPE